MTDNIEGDDGVADGDSRFMGAFVCLVGLSLYAIAASSIYWLYGQPEWLYIFGAIGLAVLGTIHMFLVLHFEANSKRFEVAGGYSILYGLSKSKFDLVGIVLAVIFYSASILVFWLAEQSSHTSPEATQFALALGDKRALYWRVPSSLPAEGAGLLTMFFGAILTIAFGLIYPKIGKAGSEDGRSFMQKLVLPILSMAVFGVGASERAEAEDVHRDVKLIEQGFPPLFTMPADLRQSMTNNIRFAQTNELSETTRLWLQSAFTNLAGKIEELEPNDGQRKEGPVITESEKQDLLARVRGLQNEVGRLRVESSTDKERAEMQRRLEEYFSDSISSIDSIAGEIKNSAETTSGHLAALTSSERHVLCLLLRAEGRDLDRLDQERGRDAEDILRRAWLGIIGRDHDANASRDKLIDAACGEEKDTTLASID